MKRPQIVIAAVVVIAIVVIGVIQTSGNQSSQGGKGPSSAAARRALAGSPPALKALHDDANALLPGDQLDARLTALRGHPVVINVWGSWCAPCREEFGIFQRVSVSEGRRVGFLGVDTQDEQAKATKFLHQHPVAYPSYLDFDGKLAKGFGLIGTPSTIFIDRTGKRTYLHQGKYLSDAALKADIRRYAGA